MSKNPKTVTEKHKDRILLCALDHAAFDGWGTQTLRRGTEDAGFHIDFLGRAFPKGTIDIIDHLGDWADRQMFKKIARRKTDKMRIRDKIALTVKTRLEILTPYKQAVNQAMSFLALPPHCFKAPRLLWRSADRIWWWAGDQATDYNHYSKRGLLSGVMGSTALFWLNDTSEDHAETWAFLERRIDNVLKIGQKLGKLKPRTAA